MISADSLARFGLLVERRFLTADECTRVRTEMAAGNGGPATVHEPDGRFGLDAATRRTRVVRISDGSRALLDERLAGLRPRAERHFGVTLRGWQPSQFLVYGPGDFYRLHPDHSSEPGAAPAVRARKVSVVVFLNDCAERPASGVYGGGALTFSGLLDDPRLARYGVPVRGETGVLVAFRSQVVHGVEPVTHGERYTVVTWFV